MKKILIIFLVLLSFNFITTSQVVQQQWINGYGNDGSSGLFIHTDLAGNVYIVGAWSGMDSPWITVLAKYNSAGTQLYGTVLDTPCQPVNAYFDNLNNEYIAGYYGGPWGVAARFTVAKLNASGTIIWRKLDSCSDPDHMVDLASDINYNPVIIKYKNGIYTIIKYDTSGNQQLQFNITDTITPNKLSIDYQNNIIISGSAYLNPGNIFNDVTIKYSPSGAKLWRALYVPTTSWSVSKIRTGNSGNIYILNGISIIKYNLSGVQQWVVQDSCSSMILDNFENVYVTGSSGTSKLNSSGNLYWHDNTPMADLAIDKFYNVYATGCAPYDTTLTMMNTIKLSYCGYKLWSITYSSGASFSDFSHAIALDTSANIYITGTIYHTPMIQYLGTIGTLKYSQFYYTVTGTVRYQDNNQPVSGGYVKDLKLDKNTYQIITLDSAAIQSNGAYSLSHVPKDSTYIMAYGNDEEDFVPTYHDSTIYWQNASVIYPTGNMTNVDVKVFREIPASGQRAISGGVFESQTSLIGVSGAIIYAKLGSSQFIRYAISGTNGNYLLDSLEQGKYQIFCDRLGYTNGYKVEPLTSFNLDTVDFYLMRIMSVTNVHSILPTSFALYQNYPNPFNPSTTIKFDIPVNVKGEMSNVKLVIYDLLGRKVAVLVNENMQPGTYKVEWNASNYASGLYFYKLSATSGAGEFTETKKLVLLK